MPLVNQKGDPVVEETIYEPCQLTREEKDQLLLDLLAQLELEAVRTNATKHGNTQVLIQKKGA